MYSIRFDHTTDYPTPSYFATPKTDARELFEHAPTALWLEDLSGLKRLFDEWRSAGVVDLYNYLTEDISRCLDCIRLLKFKYVNKKTLMLYDAIDQDELFLNIYKIFPSRDFDAVIEQLVQLWEGRLPVSVQVVNYSLTGRRMDLQLNGLFLPGSEETWEQYLLSTEDVTLRECALRDADRSAAYARQLFDHSPVSLWVFDYQAIKVWLDQTLPEQQTPYDAALIDAICRFASRQVRLVQVNSHTLGMLGSTDVGELARSLHRVLDGPSRKRLTDQLVALWQGSRTEATDLSISSLTGRKLHVQSHLSLLPGFESDWSQVLMSLTDVTDLKRAEEHLAFLNQHDSLTGLFSRSYLSTRLSCAEMNGAVPTSIVVVDINGLKGVNDERGHAEGDALIQRAGAILSRSVCAPNFAARVGGDEFVILMPGEDADAARVLVECIHELTVLDNATASGPWLSLSLGVATRSAGESLAATLSRADAEMYRLKRDYYGILIEGGQFGDRDHRVPSIPNSLCASCPKVFLSTEAPVLFGE